MKKQTTKKRKMWDRCDRLCAGMIAVSPLLSKFVQAGQLDDLERYMYANMDSVLAQVSNATGMFAVVDLKKRSAWAFESLAEAMNAYEPGGNQMICRTKVEDGKGFFAIGGTYVELAHVDPMDGQNRTG